MPSQHILSGESGKKLQLMRFDKEMNVLDQILGIQPDDKSQLKTVPSAINE